MDVPDLPLPPPATPGNDTAAPGEVRVTLELACGALQFEEKQGGETSVGMRGPLEAQIGMGGLSKSNAFLFQFAATGIGSQDDWRAIIQPSRLRQHPEAIVARLTPRARRWETTAPQP